MVEVSKYYLISWAIPVLASGSPICRCVQPVMTALVEMKSFHNWELLFFYPGPGLYTAPNHNCISLDLETLWYIVLQSVKSDREPLVITYHPLHPLLPPSSFWPCNINCPEHKKKSDQFVSLMCNTYHTPLGLPARSPFIFSVSLSECKKMSCYLCLSIIDDPHIMQQPA